MFNKWLVLFGIMAMSLSPAFAQDWGLNDYNTYEPGFYDTTTSGLYDAKDDWFYDNYTIGDNSQRQEDISTYNDSEVWGSDTDLFGNDTFGTDTDI